MRSGVIGGYLRLLESLCKVKNKVVGTKQTLRALEMNQVTICFIAKDAEQRITQPIRTLCEKRNVRVVEVPTMKQLGAACGIDVGAAAAAILVEEHTA